ncbi:MAG: phosphatase PAP2 family protein [Bacteroidales bacterium]
MRYIIIALLFILSNHAKGQNGAIELSGDVLQLAIPGGAFASTLIWAEEDYKGTWEVVKAGVVSTVATYGIKYIVNKERPNGEPYAFPSGHTSRAFTGAAFIQRKFGWKYGAPAYLLAGYTGWTRIHSGNHDYWDILGGAAVGIVSAYIFAKPYQESNVRIGFSSHNNQYAFTFSYSF